MSDLGHTVYVLTIKRGQWGSEPEHPRDIIGGRFYETEREACEAIREQDIASSFIEVYPIELCRPWTVGMPPRS